MESSYKYRPLRASVRDIRLLRFADASPPARDALIRCTVEHVSLFYDIEYNAISYCWGANPHTKTVILDGVKIQVPASAEEALRGTYSQSLDERIAWMGTPVWIDAICINQTDPKEKGRQVAMMGTIYSHAQEVRIWLGPASKRTNAALESFVRLYEDYRDQTGHELLSRDLFEAPRSQSLPPGCNERAVYEFFANPWFLRVWPIQEVILNKNTCVIQGSFAMQWELIALAASWMSRRAAPSGFMPRPGVLGRDACDRVNNIKYAIRNDYAMVLESTRTFGATDPRDNVYATLGLLDRPLSMDSGQSSTGSQRESVSKMLFPDYEKPVEEVYAFAIYTAMLHSISDPLSFLRWAQYNKLHSDTMDQNSYQSKLPSWVADLNIQARAVASFSGIDQDTKPKGADNDEPPKIEWKPNNFISLKVQGVVVSSITSHGRSFKTATDTMLSPTSIPQRFEYIWDLVETDLEFISRKETLSRFAIAAVAGITSIVMSMSGAAAMAEEEPSEEQFLKQFAGYLLIMQYYHSVSKYGVWETSKKALAENFPNQASWFSSAGSSVMNLWRKSGTTDAGEEVATSQTGQATGQSENEEKFKLILRELAGEQREGSNFAKRLRPDLLLRPLFRCSNDLVAAGWHGLAKGDILVILFGCKVPVILRNHGNFFEFVGDACVPGTMNGEYIRQLREQGRINSETKQFDIH